MTIREDQLAALLAGPADSAEDLTRHLTRFGGALRNLRDDPAEADRIDDITLDAELAGILSDHDDTGTEDMDEPPTRQARLAIGHQVNIYYAGDRGLDARGDSARHDDPADDDLEPWPSRVLAAVTALADAGGGVLVLAAATVIIALHATAVVITIVSLTLAAATAFTAVTTAIQPLAGSRRRRRRPRGRGR
jgi:hypothetical protein